MGHSNMRIFCVQLPLRAKNQCVRIYGDILNCLCALCASTLSTLCALSTEAEAT